MIRNPLLAVACTFALVTPLYSQSLQLQYDLRHSVDPRNTRSNYPSLFFEFFKLVDYGSVFVKTQADFNAERHNIGQVYLQLFREFRFWDPVIFAHVEYNGGVGIAEGSTFGYSINNAFLLGPEYPFQWGNDWESISLCYRYSLFDKPSHDVQLSVYWSKNLLEDKFSFSGSLVMFTENKDHGDPATANLTGKRVLIWGQPQVWYNISKTFSIGSQLTTYYHVISNSERVLVYPTLAVKYLL